MEEALYKFRVQLLRDSKRNFWGCMEMLKDLKVNFRIFEYITPIKVYIEIGLGLESVICLLTLNSDVWWPQHNETQLYRRIIVF